MTVFRLVVIMYLAFISLGLPDGVLGVAWPAMRQALGLPLEAMGLVTTVLMCTSAAASVFSVRVLARWNTGAVTTASCLMTGLALFGYALAETPFWLLVCTLPLGLGQGAVDAALNLHVANHYTARHMNWLHCCWGVGASLGPLVMTAALAARWGWQTGYALLAAAQCLLALVLLQSLRAGLWPASSAAGPGTAKTTPQGSLNAVPHQLLAVLLFFLYVGMEFSVGLWLNSLLVEGRHLPVPFAGSCVAAFYAAIMGGRFLAGAMSNRLPNQTLIRYGLLLACIGSLGLWLAVHPVLVLLCVCAIGLGCAPVYPGLMHETPRRFKASVTQRLMGLQVGAACLGGSLISAGMGVVLARFSLEALCPAVLLMAAGLLWGDAVLGRQRLSGK